MDNIFTVAIEDIKDFNPIQGVDYFRELVWAEARRIGIPITKIKVTSKITDKDGGVDATIDYDVDVSNSNFIKKGLNAYQIKTGTAFKPWQESIVKKELFGERNEANPDNLGSEIKNCLDNEGTYIIVYFNHDPTDISEKLAIKLFKKYFTLCGYISPKIEVW